MNYLSLWWKPGWKDRCKTLCDIMSYNDVTSALSSHEFGRNMHFIGILILKSFLVYHIDLQNFLNVPHMFHWPLLCYIK